MGETKSEWRERKTKLFSKEEVEKVKSGKVPFLESKPIKVDVPTEKKLKTVADLIGKKSYDISTMESFTWELRQAAKAWIKHFRSGEAWTDYACDDGTGHEAIESWIKMFFSISEDDLKN